MGFGFGLGSLFSFSLLYYFHSSGLEKCNLCQQQSIQNTVRIVLAFAFSFGLGVGFFSTSPMLLAMSDSAKVGLSNLWCPQYLISTRHQLLCCLGELSLLSVFQSSLGIHAYFLSVLEST